MFPSRFYCDRYFASRYFPKVGAGAAASTETRAITLYGSVVTAPMLQGSVGTTPAVRGSVETAIRLRGD